MMKSTPPPIPRLHICGTSPSNPVQGHFAHSFCAHLPSIRRRPTRRRIPPILIPSAVPSRRRPSRRSIPFLSGGMVRCGGRLRIRLAHLPVVVIVSRCCASRGVPVSRAGGVSRAGVGVRGIRVSCCCWVCGGGAGRKRLSVVLSSAAEDCTEDPEPEQPQQQEKRDRYPTKQCISTHIKEEHRRYVRIKIAAR